MKMPSLRRIDILTAFPAMFEGPLTQSLLGKARQNGLIDLRIHDLRDYSADKHRKIDDRPFGGGPGMVLQAEPIYQALKAVRANGKRGAKPRVIYLSPQGRVLTQKRAQEIAESAWIILVCGHYEGIDERVSRWIDEEVSIGDYVLTGGELPAMVLADAVLRWVPGVVKEMESVRSDSFQNGLLDYPHYTRPALWRGKKVPPVLLSGDHEQIRQWRSEQARKATIKKRPDLVNLPSVRLA
jgi:tRNA (guanine37-N1)-methyltransferase